MARFSVGTRPRAELCARPLDDVLSIDTIPTRATTAIWCQATNERACTLAAAAPKKQVRPAGTMRVDKQGLLAPNALVEVVQTIFDCHEPVANACVHLALVGRHW